MGCTACTEPQCLYKGALYLIIFDNLTVGRVNRGSSVSVVTCIRTGQLMTRFDSGQRDR